jgi:hypothetical protein
MKQDEPKDRRVGFYAYETVGYPKETVIEWVNTGGGVITISEEEIIVEPSILGQPSGMKFRMPRVG